MSCSRLPDPGSRLPAEHRPHLRPPRLGRLAHARREAPVRVDDPALRQDALQRLADQPAQEGPVGRHARRVRHRRDLHGAAQVRSRHLSRRCSRCCARSSADIAAHARLRRDDVRPPVRVADGHSGDPARARQSRRHAVVPEGGGRAAGAAHRPCDRGVRIDGRVHDARAADAGRAHQGRVSRRAARRVRAAAERRRRSPRPARRLASRPAPSRSAPSRG